MGLAAGSCLQLLAAACCCLLLLLLGASSSSQQRAMNSSDNISDGFSILPIASETWLGLAGWPAAEIFEPCPPRIYPRSVSVAQMLLGYFTGVLTSVQSE